jgi:hypothetical protein
MATRDAPPLIEALRSAPYGAWRRHRDAWWVTQCDDLLRDVPGAAHGGRGWWRVPDDLVAMVGLPSTRVAPPISIPDPLPMPRSLRTYQARIVPWALERRCVLIADAMRLGKTVESLAIAYAASEFYGPTDTHPRWVAVVPAAKLWDWAEEASVAIPDPWGQSVEIVHGRGIGKKSWPIRRDAWLYITNYEVLPDRLEFLSTLPALQGVILDETVYVKSGKSRRHKAARALCDMVREGGGYVMGLSGEPVENRPWDLWAQLVCIRGAREWGRSVWGFHKRYCGGQFVTDLDVYENRRAQGADPKWTAYDRTGISNADELAMRLSAFTVRRRKSDPEVRASLPRVVWQLLSIEGAHHAVPRAAATAVADCVGAGERPLAFCYYKATAAVVVKEIERTLRDRGVVGTIPIYLLTGDIPTAQRDKALRETRTTSGPAVIVATIDAMGMGVDISHFDQMVVCEIHYVPARMIQAAERLYAVDRMRGYGIQIVVVRGSDDERLARMVLEKVRQSDAIMGSSEESRGLGGALQQASEGGGLDQLVRDLQEIERAA